MAWFSDSGKGYRLLIAGQDGLAPPRELSIGDAKFAYYAEWSPDGKRIAFVDDRSRIRVLELAGGTLTTADTDGNLLARNLIGITWSPDSKWLAYSKAFPNRFRRIVVWSVADRKATPVTDALADAISPPGTGTAAISISWPAPTWAWPAAGRISRASGVRLPEGPTSPCSAPPIPRRSRPRATRRDRPPPRHRPPRPPHPLPLPRPRPRAAAPSPPAPPITRADTASMRIDLERIGNRILALQVPVRDYAELATVPPAWFPGRADSTSAGHHAAQVRDCPSGGPRASAPGWDSSPSPATGRSCSISRGQLDRHRHRGAARPGEGRLTVALADPARSRARVEADLRRSLADGTGFLLRPGLHGADWNAVYARYAPLVPYVRHRADLTYILDQVGGELSVGHSFVGGGDFPAVDSTRTGLLGADLVPTASAGGSPGSTPGRAGTPSSARRSTPRDSGSGPASTSWK